MITFLFSGLLLVAGACSGVNASGPQANASSDTTDEQTTPLTRTAPDTSLSKAYFAGGCFWCTEASFERIEGVQAVVSGYSGGPEKNPTYKQVANGLTGHAETVAIYYDSSVVDYPTLLDVFFVAHDPTTLNRQGPDVGTQYRSAIFYSNEREKQLAEAAIAKTDESSRYSDPVVTQLDAFEVFYDAEDYHQGYYELNPNAGYVYNVSRPKVEKVEKEFKGILKEAYK